MREVLDVLKQARETRDLASRARKRAATLQDRADHNRVLRHAEELDQQAAALEQKAEQIKRPTIF